MNEEEKKNAVRRNRVVLLTMCCFILLVGMRIMNIKSQSPEYDEIWTVQHYVNLPVGRILTDVATPNNHVLNSLGIKFFLHWIPDPVFAMRLPALLGFAGLFLLLLRGTLKLFRNKAARGAVLAVVLLDGMILHYAETARGYSLQTFFVFGLLLSLLCFSRGREQDRPFNAVLWLICATGSCLSVSSGVIFTTILTGLWALLQVPFRSGPAQLWKEYRALIVSGFCWTLFALIWYGGNYDRFAQGRANFGESFSSLGQYLSYCGNILWSSGLLWPLLVILGGCIWLRRESAVRECLLTGGGVLMMLLSAMFTKGGPVRVYLPLIPVAAWGAGMVLDEILSRYEPVKKYGMAILLAVVAVSAGFSESRRIGSADPDMGTVFEAVKKIDPHVLIAYRPTDAYVVMNLFGQEAKADHVNRMWNPSMLFLLHDNRVGTMRFSDFGTESLSPGCPAADQGFADPAGKMPYWLYRLRPVRKDEDLSGKTVLCIMHGSEPELRSPDPGSWLKKDFSIVNGFLSNRLQNLPPRYCFAADGAKLKAEELVRLEQRRSGRLFFRVVTAEQ